MKGWSLKGRSLKGRAEPGMQVQVEEQVRHERPRMLRAVLGTPLLPSLLTAACALMIHPWAGRHISRPVSFELQNGNVFAFLTLVGIAWTLLPLACRFWSSRHALSAVASVLCIALLAIIPMTEPRSTPHNLAFAGLVVIATGLFLLWAMDTLDVFHLLPPLLPIAFGMLLYVSIGVGGFQLALIGSLLVSLNLTFMHLARREGM